ncbi:TetR/AcrR family transcriptional regulator [Zeimonas arvi]|uniref:TetR/AcrR family transcriptional regulator n=1 Tax=Zeimonas arvi TaxID=2498847 RepID=A0A5C8P3C5_9BURK|nr:TetR/AcrR family transcriptional regulator [Zeimonas arvi]TXL68156.1 TetR/AcrR family transcriptional regulator [Zeimonas arvi]
MKEKLVCSESKKARTHRRIVATAAQAIRRHGYDGLGVADLMKACGLTHGGFYAHFDSKAGLLAEAAAEAGEDGIAALSRAAAQAPAGEKLAALVSAYLSDRHLRHPELGCPLAALGTETARQEPAVREAATSKLRELLALVDRVQADEPVRRDPAVVLSALVGALVLARASSDESLGRTIRRSVERALVGDAPQSG